MMNLLSLFVGGWVRWAIYGALILAYGAVAAGIGYHKGVQQLWNYQVEQATVAIKIITKIQRVVEEVLVEHTKTEIKIVTVFKEIEKEVPHVPIRSACNVTSGWMRVHDHAADGEDRRDEGTVDDPRDTCVREDQALGVIVRNYKAFHQVANHLLAS